MCILLVWVSRVGLDSTHKLFVYFASKSIVEGFLYHYHIL